MTTMRMLFGCVLVRGGRRIMYNEIDDTNQKGTGWGRSITSNHYHLYPPQSSRAVCGFGIYRPCTLYDDIEERGGVCSGRRKCSACKVATTRTREGKHG